MVPSNGFKRAFGFTIIELLVVISVIALLMAILLPSMKKARDVANTTACMAGLRQSGYAIDAYATDQREFPPSTVGNVNGLQDIADNMVTWGYMSKSWKCTAPTPPTNINASNGFWYGPYWYLGSNYTTAPGNFTLSPYFSGNSANSALAAIKGQINYIPLNTVPGFYSWTGSNIVPALTYKMPQVGFIQMACPDVLFFGQTFYTQGGTEGAYVLNRTPPIPNNVSTQAAPHNSRSATNVLFQDRHVRTISYPGQNYYSILGSPAMYQWMIQ
jgi:prepilin-type N-terminal cleavage/methylation domain-containing protein